MNTIWVTFNREGIHKYPAAGTDKNLADVSFLQHPHRHIFHIKVWIQIWHDDRDIEFIQFKRWLEGLYDNNVIDFSGKSCEMIADDIYDRIHKKYPNRYVKISVSEDNENGSESEYPVNRHES